MIHPKISPWRSGTPSIPSFPPQTWKTNSSSATRACFSVCWSHAAVHAYNEFFCRFFLQKRTEAMTPRLDQAFLIVFYQNSRCSNPMLVLVIPTRAPSFTSGAAGWAISHLFLPKYILSSTVFTSMSSFGIFVPRGRTTTTR